MQLNEVIEENSLATISKRTRISIQNIEKLVNRDFSGMRKVKAQGFISILEREFGIELDALSGECREYFASVPDEEFDPSLVISVPDQRGSRRRPVSKILLFSVVFILGYASWYFLIDKKNMADSNITESSDKGFIGTIVDQARGWLGNSDIISGTKEDIASVNDGVWAENETEANSSNDLSRNTNDKAQTGHTGNSASEENDSGTEEKIIKDVKKEQEKIIAKGANTNAADPFSINNIMGTQIEEPIDNNSLSDNTVANKTLDSEVPSMKDETVSIIKKPKKKIVKKSIKVPVQSRSMVTFHPLKKVWIGYTNLNTMKREARSTEDDLSFDTTSDRWIMVTGHGAVSFIVGGKELLVQKRTKNYFLIKNNSVRPISKEEFQKLNKSTVW